MPAMTYNRIGQWTKRWIEVPAKQHLKTSKKVNREDEFRAALDRYIADYRNYHVMIAEQRHIAQNRDLRLFRRLASWIGV